MASIVVCGGSMIGLSTSMMLARDGHDVTVLERDSAPLPASPAEAWTSWPRPGVPQHHQPHNLFPRTRVVLDEDLPGMVGKLADAGCTWVNPVELLPPTLGDTSARPDDDRFRFVTGRRPIVEWTFGRAAAEHEGVTVRRGVSIAALVTGEPVVVGSPHVLGVRTTEGDELRADLVVDAMGRRSKLVEWLQELGSPQIPITSEDSGFVYYTRYFTGPEPPVAFGPALNAMGTFSILTLPGDNDTWSLTLFTAAADVQLKALKDPGKFTKVVRACPLQQHWLDGEPISEVLPMAGIMDRHRRFLVDDRPVATGVCAVGDAWACTNPSAGRGISVGLVHAQRLRDATRTSLDDPEAFVREFDELTERDVALFFHNQIAADRARIAEMDALRNDEDPPPPNPVMQKVFAALPYDPDVFRGMLETIMCLAFPQEVLARPGFMEKVEAQSGKQPFAAPGPDRPELLALLA
jgi:2-polyprenyl-6-methoxyphenol hydroxylase-like FAD-dependent oxidoreductase